MRSSDLERHRKSPLPSGEVGAQRRVRGCGLSLAQHPLTGAQIDLSPLSDSSKKHPALFIDNGVAEDAELLDLDFDHIAGLQEDRRFAGKVIDLAS
jgi:hypothetical protein